MPEVIASWVERFATRLLQLQPGKVPLDAVRDAIAIFPEAGRLTPEDAAERHGACNKAPQSRPR